MRKAICPTIPHKEVFMTPSDLKATGLFRLPIGSEQIAVYHCDGGCKGNPGPAGYGLVHSVCHETIFQARKELTLQPVFSRGIPIGHSTNNVAELSGAIAAILDALENDYQHVLVFTDSQYVQLGITSWIKDWRQYRWRTSTGRPVANKDLWIKLDELTSKVSSLHWKWVKGHATDILNEEADRAAFVASREQRPFEADLRNRPPVLSRFEVR